MVTQDFSAFFLADRALREAFAKELAEELRPAVEAFVGEPLAPAEGFWVRKGPMPAIAIQYGDWQVTVTLTVTRSDADERLIPHG